MLIPASPRIGVFSTSPDRMRTGPCCRRPRRGIVSFASRPPTSRRKAGLKEDADLTFSVGPYHRPPWRLIRPGLPSSNNISGGSLLKGVGIELSLVASVLYVIGVLVGRRIRLVNTLARYLVLSLSLKLIRVQSLIAASSSANNFLSGNFTLMEDGDEQVPVRVWQVRGDGSCLFHSIAAARILDDLHSTSIDDARILRSCAVDVLSDGDRNLTLSGDERITSARLVEMASNRYGISPSRYLEEMKEDCVWGGGPEVVVVANSLGRQIILLEESTAADETRIELKVVARFGPSGGRGPPIYILSTNQRFPTERFKRKNHFLAVFKIV